MESIVKSLIKITIFACLLFLVPHFLGSEKVAIPLCLFLIWFVYRFINPAEKKKEVKLKVPVDRL